MNAEDRDYIANMASLANRQISPSDYDSQHGHENGSSGKRKADDGGQPQQRAKRNRYISIACNEVRSIIPCTALHCEAGGMAILCGLWDVKDVGGSALGYRSAS